MERISAGSVQVALLLLMAGALSGCGGGHDKNAAGAEASSGASQPAELKCAETTYRLSSEKIDAEINEACERVKTSHAATKANGSGRARFTCQDSSGHVMMSTLVPDSLLDDYNRNCQQFVDAEAALPKSDRQAHIEAMRKFQTDTNQLTHQSVDAANALWQKNKADKVALNQLVKARGGSIEIKN